MSSSIPHHSTPDSREIPQTIPPPSFTNSTRIITWACVKKSKSPHPRHPQNASLLATGFGSKLLESKPTPCCSSDLVAYGSGKWNMKATAAILQDIASSILGRHLTQGPGAPRSRARRSRSSRSRRSNSCLRA